MRQAIKIKVKSPAGFVFRGEALRDVGFGRDSFDVKIEPSEAQFYDDPLISAGMVVSGCKYLMGEPAAVSVKMEDGSDIFRIREAA